MDLSSHVSKQRIDYQNLPGGGVRAIVTLTLQNGQVFREVGDATTADVPEPDATEEVGGPLHAMRAVAKLRGKNKAQLAKMGLHTKADVQAYIRRAMKKPSGGLLAGVGKAVKAIASSKALRAVAKGLAFAAPILGPLAPAALGVAGVMGVASTAAAAHGAAFAGAKKKATALAAQTKKEAQRLAPKNAAKLLQVANGKAKAAIALGDKSAPKKPAAKKPAAVRALPASTPAATRVLAAARAGRVRSNRPGAVTPAQLMAAHKAGRVFFVAA